jgi:hypothetical protein
MIDICGQVKQAVGYAMREDALRNNSSRYEATGMSKDIVHHGALVLVNKF